MMQGQKNVPFLVETALLNHGLSNIGHEELEKRLPREYPWLVWVDQGEIIIGDCPRFLSFRKGAHDLLRIDGGMLEKACQNKMSGALTASGTMAVAAKWGIPLAVTAGMGGLNNREGDEICHDLIALTTLPVTLLATAPKDMLDLPGTVKWLRDHGVLLWGTDRDVCDGFVFTGEEVKLDGKLCGKIPGRGVALILNGIDSHKRFTDRKILEQAIKNGEAAHAAGAYYHPAVNYTLDQLTHGKNGELQLNSLIDNIYLADKLVTRDGKDCSVE